MWSEMSPMLGVTSSESRMPLFAVRVAVGLQECLFLEMETATLFSASTSQPKPLSCAITALRDEFLSCGTVPIANPLAARTRNNAATPLDGTMGPDLPANIYPPTPPQKSPGRRRLPTTMCRRKSF